MFNSCESKFTLVPPLRRSTCAGDGREGERVLLHLSTSTGRMTIGMPEYCSPGARTVNMESTKVAARFSLGHMSSVDVGTCVVVGAEAV